MTGRDPQFDAGYGERWDPESRALVGPLPVADARRRHAAGEPYAVLLGAPGRPRVLLEVARQQDDLTAWCFDEQLRRTFLFEFRMLGPEQMALLRMAEWRYADAGRPEFDATSPRCLTTFGRDGVVREPIGASGSEFRALDRYDRWVEAPRFGKWTSLAAFLLDTPPPRERHRIVRPARHERPAPSGMAPPWEPPGESSPGPLRPGPEIATAFGPPGRYALEPDGDGAAPEVVVETRPAGLLLTPTGRLVVADPGWLDDDLEPFTVALPRGRHPVTLAVARFAEEPGQVRVAGCRVDVREAPVVSWEQALRPGEDPSTLGDGQFFGIGVDAGMLCFFDAAALPGLVEVSEDWDEPRGLWDELTETVERDGSAELEDPETGTNLIAFEIGWGDGVYPVWIGRAADGAVACVVTDGQVLSGATYLGPAGDRQNASGGPS